MIDHDLKALIAARKKERLSQADIAKLAEVTENTIVNFENGQQPRSAWGHRVILVYKNLEDFLQKKNLDDAKTAEPIQNLIKLRRDSGLSQSEIGKSAGVHQEIVSRFETGKGIRPDSEKAILAAYAKLQAKRGDHQLKPAVKRGRGRPRNVEKKTAAAKNKRDDDEMDECMKSQPVNRRGVHRDINRDRHVGKIDAAWLKRQTESFLRQNCTAIVERERLAHFVLSTEAVYQYGRTILLAAGKNVE